MKRNMGSLQLGLPLLASSIELLNQREHPHQKADDHAADCPNRRKQQREFEYGETLVFIDIRKQDIASNLVKRDAKDASNCAS
jgi:hypothetical protein